jgi:hypothetical protein
LLLSLSHRWEEFFFSILYAIYRSPRCVLEALHSPSDNHQAKLLHIESEMMSTLLPVGWLILDSQQVLVRMEGKIKREEKVDWLLMDEAMFATINTRSGKGINLI